MREELVDFQMRLLQAEIKMNGMVAENKQREILGKSMAYGEDAFASLIQEHAIGINDFPTYRG